MSESDSRTTRVARLLAGRYQILELLGRGGFASVYKVQNARLRRVEHNLKLSLKRAQAVADYLVARQVDKSRLQIRGFGKDYPVESNTSPASRALNRRTEVVLPQ